MWLEQSGASSLGSACARVCYEHCAQLSGRAALSVVDPPAAVGRPPPPVMLMRAKILFMLAVLLAHNAAATFVDTKTHTPVFVVRIFAGYPTTGGNVADTA